MKVKLIRLTQRIECVGRDCVREWESPRRLSIHVPVVYDLTTHSGRISREI